MIERGEKHGNTYQVSLHCVPLCFLPVSKDLGGMGIYCSGPGRGWALNRFSLSAKSCCFVWPKSLAQKWTANVSSKLEAFRATGFSLTRKSKKGGFPYVPPCTWEHQRCFRAEGKTLWSWIHLWRRPPDRRKVVSKKIHLWCSRAIGKTQLCSWIGLWRLKGYYSEKG